MITSVQNNKVKEWKKLHTKKGRQKARAFIIEGDHLIEEAKKAKQTIKEIIVTEQMERSSSLEGQLTHVVSEQVFKEISQTETPQGMAAVIEMTAMNKALEGPVLLVDAVQDPGNLGTIIRTADAAGFSKVVLGNGTVDVYNDKVIRATQGSLFHITIEHAHLNEEVSQLKEKGYVVWASTLSDATFYQDVKAPKKTALIVGNEGAGVTDELIEQADERVKIPIYGQAESLNVAIASAILMYHIRL
ncbi:MAG TPA: RNA methyltransferase [Bacillota bacterium]|nr:RNA methyltransferase [Bacillota bacterium]